MKTVDKIHEQKWKERREYDTWHHNYMMQLRNKILEQMNSSIEQIDIDEELLEELFE